MDVAITYEHGEEMRHVQGTLHNLDFMSGFMHVVTANSMGEERMVSINTEYIVVVDWQEEMPEVMITDWAEMMYHAELHKKEHEKHHKLMDQENGVDAG